MNARNEDNAEKLIRLPLHYGRWCPRCGVMLDLHEQHPCAMPEVDAPRVEDERLVAA
jgi:hypothetical protein